VVTLNTRIDDWVAEAVEATRRQIEDHLKKKDPNIKVGKQDVVNQALIRGLNLMPPEGWEPLEVAVRLVCGSRPKKLGRKHRPKCRTTS
jgi:hypothetical protein